MALARIHITASLLVTAAVAALLASVPAARAEGESIQGTLEVSYYRKDGDYWFWNRDRVTLGTRKVTLTRTEYGKGVLEFANGPYDVQLDVEVIPVSWRGTSKEFKGDIDMRGFVLRLDHSATIQLLLSIIMSHGRSRPHLEAQSFYSGCLADKLNCRFDLVGRTVEDWLKLLDGMECGFQTIENTRDNTFRRWSCKHSVYEAWETEKLDVELRFREPQDLYW